jgi:hypothetical protein
MRARATPRQARKHRRSRLSPTLDGSLSRLQPHPRPAAVLVNEPDAGRLQGERASDIGSSAGDDQKITDSPCIGDPPGDRIVVMIVSGLPAGSRPFLLGRTPLREQPYLARDRSARGRPVWCRAMSARPRTGETPHTCRSSCWACSPSRTCTYSNAR